MATSDLLSPRGLSRRSRRYSSHIDTEDAPSPPHSTVQSSSTSRDSSLRPRRRSSRSNTIPDGHSQHPLPGRVDADRTDSRKTRDVRPTLRKESRPRHSTSPQISGTEGLSLVKEEERESSGFFPKLSRIIEGKENKSRRRGSSSTSLTDNYSTSGRRSRHNEDGLETGHTRHNSGHSQRYAAPSRKASIDSVITRRSSASSGSKSTLRQQANEDYYTMPKRRPAKGKGQAQGKARPIRTAESPPLIPAEPSSPSATASEISLPPLEPAPEVADLTEELPISQHEGEDLPPHDRPSSSSSSTRSSVNADARGEGSSNAGEPQIESPVSSPTSSRQHPNIHFPGRSSSESGFSVREQTPESPEVPVVDVFAHLQKAQDGSSEESEGDDEDGDEGEEGSESEDQSDVEVSNDPRRRHVEQVLQQQRQQHWQQQQQYQQQSALERVPPPGPPPQDPPSQDPYLARLRDQERELRSHLLQNPQPHRDLHYVGGPSPQAQPALPLYDMYAYPGTSNGDFQTPTQLAPSHVPPQPPQPPQPSHLHQQQHHQHQHQSHPPQQGHNPHYPQHGELDGTNPPSYPFPFSPVADKNMAMTTRYPPSKKGGSVQGKLYKTSSFKSNTKRPTVAGYESLAKKLSELPSETGSGKRIVITPMYRKFEQLNHRILLHLQDEICELEEELRQLDEQIALNSPRQSTGQIKPASRRQDARNGSELQYQRTDALGRIYVKLGQYNQALTSFHTLNKSVDVAKPEDIQAYRMWMERHAPIEAAEAKFLERGNDLLAVTSRKSAPATGGGDNNGGGGGVPYQQYAVMSLPLVLILPLMVFAIVPGFLGRLIVISLIGIGEVMVVTSTELMDLMPAKEWVICTSV